MADGAVAKRDRDDDVVTALDLRATFISEGMNRGFCPPGRRRRSRHDTARCLRAVSSSLRCFSDGAATSVQLNVAWTAASDDRSSAAAIRYDVCWATDSSCQTLARKHDAELLVEVRANAPIVVRANRIELEQVLNNLIVNVVQAMPDGRSIRVACDVRVSGHAAFASLSVRDEGTGMLPEDLVRVFDPFYTTKEVGTGTGLGLSVSYGIVHDHGETITVDSRLGVGTEFTVLLPLPG